MLVVLVAGARFQIEKINENANNEDTKKASALPEINGRGAMTRKNPSE